jgi:hypothetical protein
LPRVDTYYLRDKGRFQQVVADAGRRYLAARKFLRTVRERLLLSRG